VQTSNIYPGNKTFYLLIFNMDGEIDLQDINLFRKFGVKLANFPVYNIFYLFIFNMDCEIDFQDIILF